MIFLQALIHFGRCLAFFSSFFIFYDDIKWIELDLSNFMSYNNQLDVNRKIVEIRYFQRL